MYQIPYEAEYKCDKGHVFKAPSNPARTDGEVICAVCYQEWLNGFPKAKQITSSFRKQGELSELKYDSFGKPYYLRDGCLVLPGSEGE